MSKYIDADKLIANLERQNTDKKVIEPLIRIITSLQQEQSELPGIERAEYYYHKGVYEGLSQGRADALKMLEEFMKVKANPTIVIKQQEQPEPTCKTCGFYENNCPFIRDTFKPYPNKVCKDYTYSVMKEQEHTNVDLEKDVESWFFNEISTKINVEHTMYHYFHECARRYFELGLNAIKEESK